jgi:Protein of unknown function (DUF2934)
MDSKQQKIAERAYHKFIMRGGEHGHDLADWVEAKKEIEAEEKARKKIRPVITRTKKSPAATGKVSRKKPLKRQK